MTPRSHPPPQTNGPLPSEKQRPKDKAKTTTIQGAKTSKVAKGKGEAKKEAAHE
jgi:hypothetical protein